MYKIEVDAKNHRILLEIEGFLAKPELETMAAAMGGAVTDIRARSTWFDLLADVSKAATGESSGTTAIDKQTEHLERFGVRKIAVILGQGLAALQQKRHIRNVNVETLVFDTKAEGLAWLNEKAAPEAKVA
jgi:hypothetical protein